jgi:glycosyltransferase involved in cell wall biosynthesis
MREALNSVTIQTMTNWEMVVVNDGSPDKCGSIAASYAKQRPHLRIRALDKKNGGLSSARNFGIDKSVGFWVCALDADDYLAPTYLHAVSMIIRQHPHVTMIDANQQFFYESDWKWNVPTFSPKGTLYSGQFPVNTVYKKSDWQQAGRYTEVLPWGNEDWNLWISLGTLGSHVTAVKIDDTLLFYRFKRKSMQRDMMKFSEVVPMLQTMHANDYPLEEILKDHSIIMGETKKETFDLLQKKMENPDLMREPMLRLWLGMWWDGMLDAQRAMQEYTKVIQTDQASEGVNVTMCQWQAYLRMSNLMYRLSNDGAKDMCSKAQALNPQIKSC